MEGAGAQEELLVSCPVCLRELPAGGINSHLDRCLQQQGEAGGGEDVPEDAERSGIDGGSSSSPKDAGMGASGRKKMRLSNSPERSSGEERAGKGSPGSTPLFSLFHKARSSGAGKAGTPRGASAAAAATATAASPSPSPSLAQAGEKQPDGEDHRGSGARGSELGGESLARKLEGKPLADKLRPSHLGDYLGQDQVLGEQTLLRSLLEAHEIPSLILWGPPGCGKTTLAHIIANGSKKNGTRFVTLSATSAKTNDVREVIAQAQNEKRLCKRKTILFIDEIHRFNKSQQDTFLPHVECGTVTLIGATTENPSFQVNSALLSRCRVIVLEKLSVEAMEAILMRALKSLGIQILSQGEQAAGSVNGSDSKDSECCVCIERKAVNTLASLCDGDARTGLNGLQMAVQARLTKLQQQSSTHGCSVNEMVITEDHVKEGLQRSHILYDRAGEEHYNCISALHKSMRGSDENASLYWLARMLEGGEYPLYVARRLVRFASEDIGLADPLALTQAVAAYQGCHFIGMPECEVLLAQCVVYFARAPKSIEVYGAYSKVKACLRNHQGPLPPVPLHLRNAPTRLMKDIGYGKGYKYNPMYTEPVEQEYLPKELKGVDFFTQQRM
ncbi:ATPase WRNIP1 [Zootoca vivipara]|uniref:ATPase WRNIP1 n=1 Tax=Zootoca vivipara TaxID=8524 RepID=UPI00293BA228|nr:ATPase WRNIP1 [Zootoca vivipara]